MNIFNINLNEAIKIDNHLISLAAYDQSFGFTKMPNNIEEVQVFNKKVQDKFFYYKRMLQNDEFTLEELEESIVSRHGPISKNQINRNLRKQKQAQEDLMNFFTLFLSELKTTNSLEKQNETITSEDAVKNKKERYSVYKHSKLILDNFQNAIQNIKIDKSLDEAIKIILNCKGKIITTGMGKAGLIMHKFSSTLCSLGIPSCFLHPGEASHGDLGLIQKEDVLFVASTSGKTREIIETITLCREINNTPIIGLTSHKDSIIREKSNVILDMGEIEEAGELKLAPTTSSLIMLVYVDMLALIVSEKKGFTAEKYSKLHHSGYLGQKSKIK